MSRFFSLMVDNHCAFGRSFCIIALFIDKKLFAILFFIFMSQLLLFYTIISYFLKNVFKLKKKQRQYVMLKVTTWTLSSLNSLSLSECLGFSL